MQGYCKPICNWYTYEDFSQTRLQVLACDAGPWDACLNTALAVSHCFLCIVWKIIVKGNCLRLSVTAPQHIVLKTNFHRKVVKCYHYPDHHLLQHQTVPILCLQSHSKNLHLSYYFDSYWYYDIYQWPILWLIK